LAGCGDATNVLSFGGGTTGSVAFSEKYTGFTGSFWATTSSLNQVRLYLAGCGATDGALAFGGGTTAAMNTTEIWLGAS